MRDCECFALGHETKGKDREEENEVRGCERRQKEGILMSSFRELQRIFFFGHASDDEREVEK